MVHATFTFPRLLTQLTSIVPIDAGRAGAGIHAATISKQGTSSIKLMVVPKLATFKVMTELDASVCFAHCFDSNCNIHAHPGEAADLTAVSLP